MLSRFELVETLVKVVLHLHSNCSELLGILDLKPFLVKDLVRQFTFILYKIIFSVLKVCSVHCKSHIFFANFLIFLV